MERRMPRSAFIAALLMTGAAVLNMRVAFFPVGQFYIFSYLHICCMKLHRTQISIDLLSSLDIVWFLKSPGFLSKTMYVYLLLISVIAMDGVSTQSLISLTGVNKCRYEGNIYKYLPKIKEIMRVHLKELKEEARILLEDFEEKMRILLKDYQPIYNPEIGFTACHTLNAIYFANETVIYNKVISNIGYAYSAESGVFEAPFPGLYSFTFTGMAYRSTSLYLRLMKDGTYIAQIYSNQGWADSATNTANLYLETGSRVRIVVGYNTGHLHTSDYNCFSGFAVR